MGILLPLIEPFEARHDNERPRCNKIALNTL